MFAKIRVISACWLLLGFILLFSQPSSAQERLCDPSFEDCYTPLLDLVRDENVGIDMAFYMIELPGLANAIIARHQAGVPVRIIVEPRANLKFPGNQAILDQFRTAGIPMRYKLGDGIVHVKLMLLAGQNKVVFTGSNFGDGDVRPYVPYDNYVDGAWYISDDSAVVNSFKTRYDDTWINTNLYGNYANIPGALTRRYPTYPIDPAMNFVPNQNSSEDYASRTIPLIDQETQKIDLIMYRVTDISICDAALRAVARGLQVRLLAEPHEYRFDSSRLGAELTGPYNIDRMYAAGVQIKMRKHRGLNHQKSVLLYGQGMTIFGSSNWSWQSFNYQEEHNYFTTKPWFFNWFVNQFERKWNSATEFEAFVPLAPDVPVNLSPSNGAAVGSAPVTLTWEGGAWAQRYDIYLGTDSSNLPLIASDVNTGAAGSSVSESYLVSGLPAGTTYFWRVVGKTMANRTTNGPVWRFTTSGTPPAVPTITAISPNSGTTAGGTSITITGSNFMAGAAISLGGSAASNVTVTSSTSIIATTSAHSAGAVNVVVTNPSGQSATLASGYTYTSPSNPPSPPTVASISPNSGTTAGGTSITITGSNFMAGAAISLGGSAASNVTVTSATAITATTPAHAAGAVNVVVTNSNGLSGSLNNGFTYTSPPPPPPPASEVVLYSAEAPTLVGAWAIVSDSSAAGGARIHNADAGAPKIATPSANPIHYFEMSFTAEAGIAYRLWIRGKAQNDFWGNDSVFVQFSDSVNISGAPVFRIGTTSATEINLEDCSGCGLSGWGWQDNGWGVGVLGPQLYFQSTGTHMIRVQTREDGLSIDQIVLSPGTYLNDAPGATKNDNTILPKSGGAPPPPSPPTVASISPNSGTTAGGTSITITGSNFMAGAAISLGGSAASNVTVTSATAITATTPAHAAGPANVVVTNSNGLSGSLNNGFTYTSPPPPPPSPPTVTSISPNSGSTGGGTSITITGTNFLAGAAVAIGGTAATNVNVVSATSITATTPAHAAGPANVVVTNSNGLSGSLTNGFTYTASSETVLLEDSFNDNSLDLAKWTPHNLFSGFTDTAVAVNETNQRIQMGPLPQGQTGSHYNGIRSANAHDFSGAYCQVEMIQAPASSTKADAMLTVGKDANNYYRVYVEEGTLICQKRISGVKTNLFTAPYNAAGHRYWRIRHDQATGNVVFETAPDNSGVPGSWVLRYSEAWNSASVPLSNIIFEIKAGTWQAESVTPGLVVFDNFRVARP